MDICREEQLILRDQEKRKPPLKLESKSWQESLGTSSGVIGVPPRGHTSPLGTHHQALMLGQCKNWCSNPGGHTSCEINEVYFVVR